MINNNTELIQAECPHCHKMHLWATGESRYCQECKSVYDEIARVKHADYQRKYAQIHYVGTVINGKHTMLPTPYKRPKPEGCEICKRIETRLSYHHWDDDNPSVGLWLCHKHHMLAEALDDDTQAWLTYANLKKVAILDVLSAFNSKVN